MALRRPAVHYYISGSPPNEQYGTRELATGDYLADHVSKASFTAANSLIIGSGAAAYSEVTVADARLVGRSGGTLQGLSSATVKSLLGYYQTTDFINASAGVGSAGKPIVLDASGKIDGSMLTGGGGVGDMLASVYDPLGVADDAFDMANMAEAANAKVMTSAERTKLAGIETSATADQTAADIRALGFFDVTNGGAGTGLDADLLDGVQLTGLVQTSRAVNVATPLTGSGTLASDLTISMTTAGMTEEVGQTGSHKLLLEISPGVWRWQSRTNFVAGLGGGGGSVDSVFGRSGNVVAATSDPYDYTSDIVGNDSAVAGDTVTEALDALGTGKAPNTPEFIVAATASGLTAERVLGGESGVVTVDFATPAQANISLNALGITGAKIAANTITNAKLGQVNAGTFMARATAGLGNYENLTATQTRAALSVYSITEHINTSAGAGDAGKPIVLNGSGVIDSSMIAGGGGGIDNVVDDLTPQLGGNLDVNGKHITQGTDRILEFATVGGTPVNRIQVFNALTTQKPGIRASGGDVDIDLAFETKNNGQFYFNGTVATIADVTSPASGHIFRYDGADWINVLLNAAIVPYSNGTSGLAATNTQTAIDEVVATSLNNPLLADLDIAAFSVVSGAAELLKRTGGVTYVDGRPVVASNITSPATGHFLRYNGVASEWQNVPLSTYTVLSFNGRQGAVTPQAGDYSSITEVLSNKTLSNPVITDVNGANVLAFSATASADAYLRIVNAASSAGPILRAVGGSYTDLDIRMEPKGNGRLKINGTDVVLATRNVNTTAPITGGGDLGGDLTLAFSIAGQTPATTPAGSDLILLETGSGLQKMTYTNFTAGLGGGGGEANDGANVGAGAGVYRDKTSTTINLRSLNGVAPIAASVDGNEIDIELDINAATAIASEALVTTDEMLVNDVGTGVRKITVQDIIDLAGTDRVANDSSVIGATASDALETLDATFAGYVPTSRSVSTAGTSGLAGGGALSSNLNLAVNIGSATSTGSVVDGDQLLVDVGGALRRVTRGVLVSGLVPTTRTITTTTASSGLTGGGDMSANRSLAVDIPNTTEGTTPASSDLVLVSQGGNLRRMLRSNFMSTQVQRVDWCIDFPTAAEDWPKWVTDRAATVIAVSAALVGSSSQSVTINIQRGTNLASPTAGDVVTSFAVTSITTAQSLTVANAALAAGSYLRLKSSAKAGTVSKLLVTVFFRYD